MDVKSSTFLLRKSESRKEPNERILRYLQQEHQTMLRGLHDEIDRLKQQCAAMQQRLIYHGIIPSIDDTLKHKLIELDASLTESSHECEGLRAELRDNKKTVEHLKEQVRQQDERYQEDISARNLIVARLRKEVQEKNNAVAALTSLLRAEAGPEKAQSDQALGATHSAGGAQMGNLYEKLLKFQPRSDRALAAQTQRHPRSTISERIMEKHCRSSSEHFQNGNLPTGTAESPQINSRGLIGQQLEVRNISHSASSKQVNAISQHSLPKRLTDGKP